MNILNRLRYARVLLSKKIKKTTITATSSTERTFYLKQCSYLDQSSCLELSSRVWSRARVRSRAYLWIGARVGCRAGAWSSCVFGTEPALGNRVWRGARFGSRVARAREEFEFGSRNARDLMRRTQKIIKPPCYLGYNSDSQLSVSDTSGFEVEDLLKSQDNMTALMLHRQAMAAQVN